MCTLQVLLTHSCVDTNARDRYHGLTPKEIAQLQGHREVAELLEVRWLCIGMVYGRGGGG